MTRQKFAKILDWGKAFTIFGTPVYQEFLAGKRELTCTAWAIPTYNIKGWKGAVLPDDRRPLRRLSGNARRRWTGKNTASWTAWRATRAARIAWSIAATTPAARSARITSRGDNWKNFKYNFGAKPKPFPVFAGTGKARLQRRLHRQRPSGRGEGRHQSGRRRARRVLAQGRRTPAHVGSHCGTSDTPNATSCWPRSRTEKD